MRCIHKMDCLTGQRGTIGGTKSWARGFAPREDKVRVRRGLRANRTSETAAKSAGRALRIDLHEVREASPKTVAGLQRWAGRSDHQTVFRAVGNRSAANLNGCRCQPSPSHRAKVASFPGTDDLLDPTTNSVDRLVPGVELWASSRPHIAIATMRGLPPLARTASPR